MKKRTAVFTLLLLTVLFTCINQSLAQEWQHIPITRGDASFISVNPHDTTEVFAATSYNVYLSNDYGQNFINVSDMFPEDMSSLRDIYYHPSDPSTIIIEDLHHLYITNDGGLNWEGLESRFINAYLNATLGIEGQETLICIDYNTFDDYAHIQRSGDFGTTWSLVDSFYCPYTANLAMNYDHSNPDHIVLASSYGDSLGIMESYDAGDSWARTRSYYCGYIELMDIYVDPQDSEHFFLHGGNNIWEFVFYHSYSENDELEEEVNYGSRSNIIHEGNDGSLIINSGNRLVRTTNAGLTYNIITTDFPNIYNWEPGMYCSIFCGENPENPSSMFFSNRHGMFYSYDYGENLIVTGQGISTARVYNLHSHNGHIYADTEISGIWEYDTTANQWINLSPRYMISMDVAGVEENNIFAGGTNLLRSLDGGESFTTIGAGGIVFGLALFDTVVFMRNGYNNIARSFDYGATWTDVESYGTVFTCDETGSDIVYFSQTDSLKRSYDYGDTWEFVSAQPYFQDMAFTNMEGVFYARDFENIIYYTEDNGTTFININGNLADPGYAYRVMKIQPGNFGQRIFIPSHNGVFYAEAPDGNWTRLDGDYGNGVSGIAFSDDGTDIYVSTLTEGIWIGQDIFNDVENNELNTIPETFGITKAYPNPFNSSVRLEYNLTNPSDVTIQVFNINGQLINTIFSGRQQAGNHSTLWDGSLANSNSKAASGIYYINLQSNERSSIQKIIMLK